MPQTVSASNTSRFGPWGQPVSNQWYQCSVCQGWYATGQAHYCTGINVNPNITIGTGTTPGIVTVDPEPEEEVKLCPRCEEETDKWDEDDYICRDCRYGRDDSEEES